MYYINKIIGWCLSPLGILYVGIATGWCLRMLASKYGRLAWGRKVGAWMIGVSLVVGWILCSGVTTRFLGAPLEREFVRAGHMCGEIGELPDVDAIVLLGGGMGAHEQCHAVELMQGSDRVRHAAQLWKAYHASGKTIRIFCTGGGVAFGTIPFLVEMGVPESSIEFSEDPRNTAEEATWLASKGVKKIALVTSAWHMKRSRMLYARKGFLVSTAPCDFEMTYVAESKYRVIDFFPYYEGIMRNTVAMKEWVAILGYSIYSGK